MSADRSPPLVCVRLPSAGCVLPVASMTVDQLREAVILLASRDVPEVERIEVDVSGGYNADD
jgi:hypothetical protein